MAPAPAGRLFSRRLHGRRRLRSAHAGASVMDTFAGLVGAGVWTERPTMRRQGHETVGGGQGKLPGGSGNTKHGIC